MLGKFIGFSLVDNFSYSAVGFFFNIIKYTEMYLIGLVKERIFKIFVNTLERKHKEFRMF